MTSLQMRRYLHDIPCLWALAQHWDPKRDSISIGHATLTELSAQQPQEWKTWIYRAPDREGNTRHFSLLPLEYCDNSFGAELLYGGGLGTELVILFRQDGERNEARVLRAPRGYTWWQYLQRFRHDKN